MADIEATPCSESPEVATAADHESSTSAIQVFPENAPFTENSLISDTPMKDSQLSTETQQESPLLDLPQGDISQMPVTETKVDTEPKDSIETAIPMTESDDSAAPSARAALEPNVISSQTGTPHTMNRTTDVDSEVKTTTPLRQIPSRSQSQESSSGSAHDIPHSPFDPMQFVTPTADLPVPAATEIQTPQAAAVPSPLEDSQSSKRHAKNYILPDGTVISGKGLGRGRPGIPRGPKVKVEDPTLASGTESPVSAPASAKTPGPRQVSKKRKRALSGGSTTYSPGLSLSSGSRASSAEYNPTGTTRSGRITQKPTSVLPQASENTGVATKRPKAHGTSSTPNGLRVHPKIKRRVYRGREQLALCEHCLRGYGPSDNVIVFCDACNKCWHQRCHDPQVAKSVVADTKAQWFCADCDRILHGKKTKKAKAVKANLVTAPPNTQPQFEENTWFGADLLTTAQQTSYLQSLSREELIRVVLKVGELAPYLPIFKRALPALPAANFSSTYTTPASATPTYRSPSHAARADHGEDEGYETYIDEHALLYPRAGHGIKLPPEKDDMHILLENKNSRTFSHWVGVLGLDHVARKKFSGTGDVLRE